MKQSKKLLSLVLAIILMFGTVSVVANAGLVKENLTYDRIDDVILSAEDVADLILDMVDEDVMPSINKSEPLKLIDIGIIKIQIRTDTVDHMLADITDLIGTWNTVKGMFGDLKNLDLSPVKNVQRSDGNLEVLYALVELLGKSGNAEVLSKAAYGIETKNGLDLGLIANFLKQKDIDSINEYLGDVPQMLKELVYDELIRGSYSAGKENDSYPKLDEKENVTLSGQGFTTFEGELNRVIYALLALPQDYEWVKTENKDENGNYISVKEWDMDSIVFPSIAANFTESQVNSALSLENHSIFQILDTIAPYAINDLGIAALNNNLKKQLMEAVDVDFNEINESDVPADVKKIFDAEDYVTYISYDCLKKGTDGAWYYTTLKNTEVIDLTTGEAKVDEKGNKVTEKTRKYYKANALSANEFYDVINWDWEFVADSQPGEVNTKQALNCIDYEYLISTYGSIFGSLNHLVYVVYENALTDAVKADFKATTGKGWVDGKNEDCLMDNLTRLGKYLLSEYGDKMFGKDSAYANISYESIKDSTVVEIIADMGPGFFADAMPQLIMPINKTTGKYAFGSDNQLLKFGALVIREFVTEVSPTTNYDKYIFAAGNVKSADDRQFATHTTDEWFNLILNMGMDIAYTYLDQLTNFAEARPTMDITAERWQGMLDKAIMWAVKYVGTKTDTESTSVLSGGFDYDTINAIDGPLNKLSAILNKLLPLGFITGCTTKNDDGSVKYAFDVQTLFDKIKTLFVSFDLNAIIGLFGRNKEAYNILDTNVEEMLLKLVNDILKLVLNTDLIPTSSMGTTLDTVITQANLKTIIKNLLVGLNNIKKPLLTNALPILGKLMPEWGGEQKFKAPEVKINETFALTNGAATGLTFVVNNGSQGVWRGYIDQSGNRAQEKYQYRFQLTSVTAYNYDGSTASPYVTFTSVDTTSVVDYGGKTTVTFDASGVPDPGAIVRFVIKYKAFDEDGNAYLDGYEFETERFAWLSYNVSDENTYVDAATSDSYKWQIITNHYIPLSNVMGELENVNVANWWMDKENKSYIDIYPTVGTSATQDGITMGSFDLSGTGTLSSDDVKKSYSITNDKGFFYNERNIRTDEKYVAGDPKPVRTNDAQYKNIKFKLFKNGSETFQDKDGESEVTFNFAGAAFDESKFNKKSGESSTWMLSTFFTKSKTSKGDGVNSKNTEFKIVYYDDTNFSNLVKLVNSENKTQRKAEEYYSSGTYNATKKLVASNADISKVETKFDKTTTVNGEEVTVINAAEAWTNYYNALSAAIQGAYQEFIGDKDAGKTVYNFEELYNNLRIAVADLQYVKKVAVVSASSAALDVGEMIVSSKGASDLKTTVKNSTETYISTKDYTDYKMYRLNRYNDVLKTANNYINRYYAAKPDVADSKYFPYNTGVSQSDLKELVKNITETKYDSYITALLEDYTAEEYAKKQKELENAKESYANITALDVAQVSVLLPKVGERLLLRDGGVDATYLNDEIASAKAMITDLSKYTDRSVTRYEAALAAAEAVAKNPTQMTAFDAKYELQVARNGLVLKADEADYTDLEALIAQAEYVLGHASLYDNTDKEFGQVLAELGYDEITNADGDKVQLFPGSALLVNQKAYAKDDQKKIDRAANALREALARMKFTGVNVGTTVDLEKDDNDKVTKTAQVLTVAQKMTAEAILAATPVQSGATGVLSSNDYYALDGDDAGMFAGTGSTYTWVAGDAPICTVKIVVKGDVNGDGVIDVLDAAIVERVSNNHGKLTGLEFIAGNVIEGESINAEDYGAVVNLALAG